jgi:hypothetical protein
MLIVYHTFFPMHCSARIDTIALQAVMGPMGSGH